MKRIIACCLTLTIAFSPCSLPGKEKPTLKIGILHSLTGTMAISESSLVDAMLMAIDEINSQGGVLGHTLVPVVEDGKSDWPTFARKAEKLIVEDNVISIFGCWTSSSRKAVLPVIEKHAHLLWYPVQSEGNESSPHIIYTGAAPNQQIIPGVDWCLQEFGNQVFLVGSDYLFPRQANKMIKQRLKNNGAKLVGEEYRVLGDVDFKEIINKIQAAKPDFILNTINGDSNRAFFQTFHAAGISPEESPIMSFSVAEEELRNIDSEFTTGHFACWNYFQSIKTPANRRFVRTFKKRYGEDRVTDDPIEAAYFQIHLFAKAAEKAGSNEIDAIRKAARGLIFAAPGGLVRIDPQNQHTWKVSRIGRIESDGQFQITWSSEDPLPPRPYLPEFFLAESNKQGDIMFQEISRMINLEKDEPADKQRKQLLIYMADVRGFLGDARTKFRNAALSIQPGNLPIFHSGWDEFEKRWALLTQHQEHLTDQQKESYTKFNSALDVFNDNAKLMLDVLYKTVEPSTEVTP